MLKIGLTGGIGSGKTTVAKIFEVLAVPVYYADDAAKFLMNNNVSLKAKIIENFGDESYKDGKLNKPFIASIVFSNAEKSALLNSIVHPVTIADALSWMESQKSEYVLKEAAILFESNAHKDLDLVIGVSAPLNLRVQRIMQRDSIDEANAMTRINKQMDQTEKMNRCDFVIENNEVDLLIPQVVDLHKKILTNLERIHN